MNILKKCRRALATLLAVGTAFVATTAWAATPLPTPTWTSQSVSGAQIKLEWSKVAEAQKYALYSKESTASNFTQRVVYGNSTTFNGVKNKSYDFYVVANPKYNANYDKSAASETKTVELSGGVVLPPWLEPEPEPEPEIPELEVPKAYVIAPALGIECDIAGIPNCIILRWTLVADAVEYDIYIRDNDTNIVSVRGAHSTATEYKYYQYNLKDHSYTFWVVPVTAGSMGDTGVDERKITEYKGTNWNYQDEAGTDWRPRVVWNWEGSSSIRITVSWDAVPNAKRYRINIDGRWYETTAPNYTFTESIYRNGNWPNSAYCVAILTDGSEVTSKTYSKSEIENMVE